MAKSQFDVLREEFQNECKVINLKYEYEGYIENLKKLLI